MANTKTPKDHKPANDEILTIETPKGAVKVYPIRPSTGFLRKNRKLSEMDQTWTLVEEFADEKALEIIDQLDPETEFPDFMQEWQDATGIEVGES